MLIFNSFNHTKEKPRFRAVMLTTQAVTAEVHEMMFDMVEAKLRDAGYVGKPKKGSSYKKSGLDRSKRPANSLFYLPCQAKSPADSFAYHATGSDRNPIDPAIWIQHIELPREAEQESNRSTIDQTTVDQIAIDRAIAEWRQSPSYPGQGNDRFYKFGLDLKKAGMDAFAIRSTLATEASCGRSPEERRNQIPSIMKSLFGRRTGF